MAKLLGLVPGGVGRTGGALPPVAPPQSLAGAGPHARKRQVSCMNVAVPRVLTVPLRQGSGLLPGPHLLRWSMDSLN